MTLLRPITQALCLLATLAGPLRATLQRTDGPATVANPAGVLVGADAVDADPATNRHLVQLRIFTTLRAQGASNNSGSFRVRFALTDDVGVGHPLDDGAGGFTTILTTDAQSVFLLNGEQQTLSFAVDAAPFVPLDFARPYRVQAEIQRLVGGVWTTQAVRQGDPVRFIDLPATASPDAAYNIVGRVETPTLARPVIVRNPDGSGGFEVAASLALFRYDDIGEAAPDALEVGVTTTLTLHNETTDSDVPLLAPTRTDVVPLPGFVETEDGREPATATVPLAITAELVDWTTLNAAHTYSFRIAVSYTEADASEMPITPATVPVAPPQRLLALSGVLRFGGTIDGVFSSIAGDPRPSFLDNGDGTWDGAVIIAAGNGQIGASSRRFGDGVTPLGVVLFQNGDLACLSGSLPFNTTGTDLQTLGGVRVIRGPATLDNTGLVVSQFFAILPTGLGFTTTAQSNRLRAAHAWTNLPCDDDLLPLGVTTLSIEASAFGVPALHVVQDGQPVRMLTSVVEWNLAAGTFTLDASGAAAFVRSGDDAVLAAATGVSPPSNDGYFRSVVSHQNAVVAADAEGRAVLSATFQFSGGDFRAHHPFNAQVAWTGGGALTMEQGRVVVAGSSLSQPSVVEFPYERGCSKDGTCAQTEANTLVCQPQADWAFTPDGGLRATMMFAAADEVRWGKNGPSTYAHRTAGFEGARFHMTGTSFRPSELGGLTHPTGQQAAILHHSGWSEPGDDLRLERPGVVPAAPAREGRADYAGLNFRATEMAVRTATSRLAGGSVGPYPLHPAAKYYARFSGVSGRHQAAASTPGAPSVSSVVMFGFQCQLDGLKLGYLDSDNVFSLTGGSINVPGPSSFDQTFAELRFDCAGRPRDAALADEDLNDLIHWSSRFRPLTFRFQPEILAGGCPSFEDGVLALGAAVLAPTLTSQPLHAELGFKPDGTLTTKADGPKYDGTSSELMLPPQLKFNGGNGPEYALTPHGKAYFSRATAVSPPAEGWINLYGGLDVPFFQDVKVHVHAANSASPTGSLFLMGGWPASDAAANVHGWADAAGKTPFNDALFDAAQTGFGGPSRDAYRDPGNDQPLYRPRAEQDWLEVVKLGYALKWETASRRFTTLRDEETNLVVIKAKHRLLSLTSSTAEITFGVKVEGFPALNVSKLLADQLNGGINGLLGSLTAAGLNASGLNGAVRDFDALLAAQIGELLNGPLDTALAGADFDFDPVFWAGSPGGVATVGAGLYSEQIAGLAKAAEGESGELTAALATKLNAVVEALTILESLIPTNAPEQNLAALVQAVLSNAQARGELNPVLAASLGAVVSAASSTGQTAKSIPAFEELRASVGRLRGRITTLRDTLNAPNNPLRREIDRALSNQALYQPRIQAELTSYFAPIGVSGPQIQAAIAERGIETVRRDLRERVRRVLITSAVAGPVQAAIKQHLAEPQVVFRGALDSLFGEVNRAIRDGVKEVLDEGAADALGLNSLNAGLGALSTTFKGFGIDGYAQINGDSLQRLRIDGKLSLKAADEMEFRGWLQIDALNARTPRTKCYCDDPDTMRDGVEVTVGGEAPFSLFGGGDNSTKLRAQGQFAFGACGPGTSSLLGVAGSFFLQGNISVASIQIKELGLTFAFGRASNYFGARARAAFQGYEFAGAFFAGTSCGLGPLVDVDPDIVELLASSSVGVLGPGDDPESTRITGLYVYAEGWMPLNNLIGIPDSCLFSLRAGAGAGPFAFVKSGGGGDLLLLGSKQFFGITADVLCLAHAEASVKLLGSLSIPIGDVSPQNGVRQGTTGLALRLLGMAEFEVEVGPCPFCISFSKDVKFHAQLGGNATSFGFGH